MHWIHLKILPQSAKYHIMRLAIFFQPQFGHFYDSRDHWVYDQMTFKQMREDSYLRYHTHSWNLCFIKRWLSNRILSNTLISFDGADRHMAFGPEGHQFESFRYWLVRLSASWPLSRIPRKNTVYFVLTEWFTVCEANAFIFIRFEIYIKIYW